MKKMIIALLLLLAVNSWSTCTTTSTYMYATGTKTCSDGLCVVNGIDYYDNYRCDGGYIQAPKNSCNNGTAIRVNYACRGGADTPYMAKAVYTHCQSWGDYLYYDRTVCTTKCEADSAAHYSSCVSQANHFWDSDSCKCKERTEADSTFTVCTEDVRNGNVYSSIYSVTCHYSNGTVTTCCGVSPNSISGEGYKSYCPMVRQERGTCEQNGVPNGPSPPSNGTVPFLPTAQCYAVVGYTCYMRDYASGRTFSCECDGSCSKANHDMVSGLGCRNPYPQPTQSSSSESGGSSSPSSSESGGSSSPSSSESGGSSSPSSSAGAAGDYTQQLDQLIANTQGIMNNTGDISQWTQETMNNTIDINNKMTEMGVDVGNIRDNTAATKENTYNIANQMNDLFNQFVNYVGNQNQNQHAINSSLDSIRNSNKSVNGHVQSMDGKLTQTNSLLDSLTKKEWGVSVEVAGDTIINNVNVQGDTAKSGAAILDFLRNIFNGLNLGSDYSENDTLGMGSKLKGTLDSLEDINGKADSVPNMSGQLGVAKEAYGAAYQMLVDSMNNAMGDSVNAWSSHITNNGVLSGDGSNDCPSILNRTWSISFPIGNNGFSVTIPAIGGQLCRPISILGGATFWTLCRVILRMVVAIMCMMWVYRAVIGADSNED